jgi:hypothetical protein
MSEDHGPRIWPTGQTLVTGTPEAAYADGYVAGRAAGRQEARADLAAPKGDLPDALTVDGHLFVHVAACPCPRIQAVVARLATPEDEP